MNAQKRLNTVETPCRIPYWTKIPLVRPEELSSFAINANPMPQKHITERPSPPAVDVGIGERGCIKAVASPPLPHVSETGEQLAGQMLVATAWFSASPSANCSRRYLPEYCISSAHIGLCTVMIQISLTLLKHEGRCVELALDKRHGRAEALLLQAAAANAALQLGTEFPSPIPTIPLPT